MIGIETDHFNPARIAASGQCFRWREAKDGGFLIPAFGRVLKIYKTGDKSFEMDCPEDDWREIWSGYLDINEDYGRFADAILSSKDEYLKGANWVRASGYSGRSRGRPLYPFLYPKTTTSPG